MDWLTIFSIMFFVFGVLFAGYICMLLEFEKIFYYIDQLYTELENERKRYNELSVKYYYLTREIKPLD